jgi:hypothetical protein
MNKNMRAVARKSCWMANGFFGSNRKEAVQKAIENGVKPENIKAKKVYPSGK